MKKILLISTAIVFSQQVEATKPECQRFYATLENIQSKLRAGYTAKQGRKLKAKEDKAREKWWHCQTNRSQKKRKAPSKRHVKNRAEKTTQLSIAEYSTTFTTKVHIKAKYEGKVQQQWLDFYRPAKSCLKPKTLAKFSACLREEQAQQKLFEQQLVEALIP